MRWELYGRYPRGVKGGLPLGLATLYGGYRGASRLWSQNMTLEQIVKTVEDYERRLPYNIRYRVGQDGPLVWVQAWDLRWVPGLGEPQRKYSQKVVVLETYGKYGPWTPASSVIEAAFEAASQLMETCE